MSDITISRGKMHIGRGVNAKTLSIRKIGKGMFSTAYIAGDGRVYVVTKDDQGGGEGDYAKEILASLLQYGVRSPYIPPVRREGQTYDASVVSMPQYKAPLRKSDSPKAWAQYRALERCKERAERRARGRVGYRGRMAYEGHAMAHDVVECAAEDPDVPAGLVRALEELAGTAADYGASYTFEFSPRNLATTPKGHLILLDVLFDMEAVERQRAAAERRRQMRSRYRRY